MTPVEYGEALELYAEARKLVARLGRALADIERDHKPLNPSSMSSRVIRATEDHFGHAPGTLRRRGNQAWLVRARSVAITVLRQVSGPDISLTQMGHVFGMHHSSVIYAIRRVRAARETDPVLDAAVKAILEHFTPPAPGEKAAA